MSEPAYHCPRCGKPVKLNNLTGNIRHHLWPADRPPEGRFARPGKQCPGTGYPPSKGSEAL